MGTVIECLAIGILAIIIAYCYFYFIEGLSQDIFAGKLIKISSEVNLRNCVDLFISYFIGFILYLVLLINLGMQFSEPLIMAILVILFLGRIITSVKGAFYGRLHYTALIASSTIVVILRLATEIFFPLTTAQLGVYDISQKIYGWNLILIDTLYAKDYMFIVLFGVLLLSTIGELIISLKQHSPKSFISVSEYIPNCFTIGSRKNFGELFEKAIFQKELSTIKITTKSLAWVDKFISISDRRQLSGFECEIIMSPKDEALESLVKRLKSLPTMDTQRDLIIEVFKKEYAERLNRINRYKALGLKMDIRESHLGDYLYL